ncbi:MAG: ABC transporter permease [Eubacteriales bacterium]|nr:ABC transporter permease [Eubacteriales bacterium]
MSKKNAGQAAYKTHSYFSRYGLLTIIAVFFVIFSLIAPKSFLNLRNWSALVVGQVAVVCVALGAICPMIAGEFDFSVGYMLGMCAMVGAVVAQTGAPPAVVILSVLLTGACAGLANGCLSVLLRLNSTVVTLGMGLVYYGVIMGISGGGQTITGNIPAILKTIAKTKVLNFNLSVWIILLCAGLLYYVLEHTPFGKQLYATGLAERASYLNGVRTKKVKIISFVMTGLLIALGGLILLGQSGAARPNTGPSYLLPAYAITFLSITTHKPGQFNVPGLLLSSLMLAVGFNGLSLIGGPYWMESVFNGLILITAILTTKSDARGIKIG